MTERKRAEAQSFALAVEQERVKVLSAFIQNASHEFRTPLAIIGSSVYLLSRSGDEENRLRHVEKAESQIKHITHLIEILIAMTQLDSGAPLNCQPINLTALVDELAYIVGWEMSKRKLNLNLETPKKNVMIQGDFDQLHAALRHVLENAQRYTPPGGTITVSLDAANEQKRAIIKIRDTGPGISSEALPHIFERFWREDNAHTTPGFGIGLPLAQKIIAAHGGSITVESELGEGSTFIIALPLEPENITIPNPTI
jgi:signal transduction histidine kinase